MRRRLSTKKRRRLQLLASSSSHRPVADFGVMSLSALTGKRIVLGVAGGIAAYKSVEVCRRLTDAGAHVTPILTSAAQRFIGAATFDALASEPAQVSLWDGPDPSPHTSIGKRADIVIIAPATADILARYTAGFADDLLTATLLATTAPVLCCVAMHTEMWEQASVQENLGTLRRRGVHILEPGDGALASGDTGRGRMREPIDIVSAAAAVLAIAQDLIGKRVLVSAGGTREPIDPVRFIGNRSSGKQGYAIAHEAARRGATVTIVSTVNLVAPAGSSVVRVNTAAEMETAMLSHAPQSDIIIMSAAVADFRPKVVADSKIKKHQGAPEIILEPTSDILAALGRTKRADQILIGFAAETDDLRTNALSKLQRKNLDFIVANDVSQPGVGFEHDTNAVTIFCADGDEQTLQLRSKSEIATHILTHAAQGL
jgi:phosphopantothenoylcysteine decarboxylase / phosphopantothenate---cysteine ligase